MTVISLPYPYRLATTMVWMVLWVFGRDVRMTALMALLAHEVDDLTKSNDDYDNMIDAVANHLKLEHDLQTNGGPPGSSA